MMMRLLPFASLLLAVASLAPRALADASPGCVDGRFAQRTAAIVAAAAGTDELTTAGSLTALMQDCASYVFWQAAQKAVAVDDVAYFDYGLLLDGSFVISGWADATPSVTFVAKVDNSGNVIWFRQWSDLGWLTSAEADADGNLWFLGSNYVTAAGGTMKPVYLELDATGAELARGDATLDTDHVRGLALTIAPNGAVLGFASSELNVGYLFRIVRLGRQVAVQTLDHFDWAQQPDDINDAGFGGPLPVYITTGTAGDVYLVAEGQVVYQTKLP